MKISPVSSYQEPDYPTKELFVLNPHLLWKYTPNSWKKSKLVANALLAFILSGTGAFSKLCAEQFTEISARLEGAIDQPDIPKIPTPPIIKQKPVVAPIFIHGEGRGATGCVVMSPPVFISEEEARQVIEAEFAKENLSFDKSNFLIDNVNFSRENRVYSTVTENGKTRYLYQKTDTIAIPFILDRFNSSHKFGYEYISPSDQEDKFGIYSYSTATSFDLLKLANDLRDSLENNNNFPIAIFYEPFPKRGDYGFVDKEYEKGYTKDKLKAKELLRAQVTDFISWAKKEGILPVNDTDIKGK